MKRSETFTNVYRSVHANGQERLGTNSEKRSRFKNGRITVV